MLKIFQYNKNNISLKELRRFSSVLSDKEKKRAKKFRFEKDYKLFVIGKIMARQVIAGYLNCPPEKIVFRTDEYDRPFLEGPEKDIIDFNLSHSGDYVALAVSDQRVGIDIERIKSIDKDIAHDCFHDREIEYLFATKEGQLERFFQVWTLKESFIKYIGQGLSYPLKNFYFSFDTAEDFIDIFLTKEGVEMNKNYSFQNRRINQDYMLSFCAQAPLSGKIIIKEFKL